MMIGYDDIIYNGSFRLLAENEIGLIEDDWTVTRLA